jgi:hypothetical protein
MGRRRKEAGFSYVSIVSSAYIGPDEYERAQRAWSSAMERPKGQHSGRRGRRPEPLPPPQDDPDDILDDLS